MSRPAMHGFIRLLPSREVGRNAKQRTLTANSDECRSLAEWLKIPAVHSFSAEIKLTPFQRDGVSIHATGVARVALMCGVTFVPFDTEIPIRFTRRLVPPQGAPEIREIEIAYDDGEDDEDELPQGNIDLGAILTEELSLALPPFPRKPDAVFDAGQSPKTAPELMASEKVNPFNKLSKLTNRDSDT